MSRQLVFDLSRAPGYDKEDFLVSRANEAAVTAVGSWPDWPSRTLLLVGPPGSGKSHLAAIWSVNVGAKCVRADALTPTLWDNGGRRVLLEDCDLAPRSEPALFHTLNLVHETGGWLLITARTAPSYWKLKTPDLLSRLRLAPLVSIEPPDIETMKAVLIKLFADRQIMIEADVVSYAVRNCDRTLESASRFVAAVDEAGLVTGRRITRSLAASTLAQLESTKPD